GMIYARTKRPWTRVDRKGIDFMGALIPMVFAWMIYHWANFWGAHYEGFANLPWIAPVAYKMIAGSLLGYLAFGLSPWIRLASWFRRNWTFGISNDVIDRFVETYGLKTFDR